MSDVTTRGIRVQVESFYDAERSAPQENYYFFAYQVRITNVGSETAQLMSREWVITDANGEVQKVQGAGVVGEQPVLAPGRVLRVHQLLPADDAGGRHARLLPHDVRRTARASTP